MQGFFSRLTASRGEVGSIEIELNPRDLLLEEGEADRLRLVEEVANEPRPQHPLSYDAFYLCECARENKLNQFNVTLVVFTLDPK